MSISFATIPATIRTTGQFAEFSSSRASEGSLATIPNRVVLVGLRKTGAGTVITNILSSIPSLAAAEGYWGHGSQMAHMVEKFKAAYPYTELWGVGIEPDVATGVKGAGSFAFSGTATAAGVINVYIGGEKVASVPVAINDAAATYGAAITAAIVVYCASHNLPVAATGTATVTITAIDKGIHMADMNLALSLQTGESLPTTVACTITQPANSAGAIDVTSAIAAVGTKWCPTWITGIYDVANVPRFEAAFAAMWGPMVQHDTQLYYGALGSQGTLASLGTSRNSATSTLMGGGLSPTPPWVWACDAGGADANESDPSRPRQTLALPNCVAPAGGSEFTWTERNTLLGTAVSTYTVNAAGTCQIERLITTYHTSPAGAADTSYTNIETMRALAYLRYTWNAWVNLKFPRYKLAADGTEFDPGQPIVTPKILKVEAAGWFQAMINAGQAQDMDTFVEDLNIQINSSDPDRFDMVMTPRMLACFRVLATRIDFLR